MREYSLNYLTSDEQAIVSVRPYIPYLWNYTVGTVGLFAKAYAKGVSMLLPLTMAWSSLEFAKANCSKTRPRVVVACLGGEAWLPDVALDLGWNRVRLSWSTSARLWSSIGHAAGSGLAQGWAKWVVVERFIAG